MNLKSQRSTVNLAVAIVFTALALPTAAAAAESVDGASPDWFAAAQQEIIEGEYSVTWAENPAGGGAACFQAPNRSQNLRFFFSEQGAVRIQERVRGAADWAVVVQPHALRRDGEERPVRVGSLEIDGRHATYHDDMLVQELSNEHQGLIHQLVLERALEDEGAVRVVMAVDGATIHREPGGGLEIRHESRPVLAWRAVEGRDANGRELEVRLEAPHTGGAVEIVVDDRRAVYPLTVKTVLSLPGAPTWYGLGYEEYDSYGFSVATAGDVNGDEYSDIVIGATGVDANGHVNAGAAYLYLGTATGLSSAASWSTAGGGDWWELGHAVATAGDVNSDGFSDVAIGIPGFNDGVSGYTDGAVWVFYGSTTGLSFTAEWQRSGPTNENNSGFGFAVATAGDANGDGYSDLLVGEPHSDSNVGKVYLYYGSPSGLVFVSQWHATGNVGGYEFGHAVAGAGDLNADGYSDIVVGEPYYYHQSKPGAGRVAVFFGSSGGPITPATYLVGDQEHGHLGFAVSTAGDVNGDGYSDFLAAAPDHDGYVGSAGTVYLYYGGSTFDSVADWTASGETAGGAFGSSIALAGDVNGDGYADILIGEPEYSGSATSEGRALLWLGGEGGPALGWPGYADWTRSSGVALARLGASLATAGDVNGDGYSDVIVGAPGYEYSYSGQGLAFVFQGGPDSLSSTPQWSYESNWSDADLGMVVASAGDINGDGFADVIVGAPYYDSSYANEGAVLLFLGSSTGLSSVRDWFARGTYEEVKLGWAAGTAGDLNGDGYSDIVVGAPYYDHLAVDSGAVFVWYGSSNGLVSDGEPANADWFASTAFGGGLFGYSVAAAGDVNGDGYGDLAVGAPSYFVSSSNEGGVFVWHGSAAGLGANGDLFNADWSDTGDAVNLVIGTSLSGAGDVNGDGFSDLIAGGFDVAAVWHGSVNGLTTPGTDWVMSQGAATALFGRSVAGAGDVNGDGYSDVVVGAPLYTQYYTAEGAAWAFCGSPAGLGTGACWWDTGFKENAYLGMAVAGGGDLNGDGYADIAVGAPGWSNPSPNEGQARVYYGSELGPVSFNNGDWTAESDLDGATMGRSLAGVGDVNGDGYGDLVVGVPGYTAGQLSEGRVSLFYGNGRPGMMARPRQLTTDDVTPIAPLGPSDSETDFVISLLARSATGIGEFMLDVEVKPVGIPFDGTNVQRILSPAAGYLNGVTILRGLTNLIPGTLYHWRSRVVMNPVTNPFSPPHSRWFHMPWNGWNEGDLRTKASTTPPPDPIFANGFESGGLGGWSSHSG